MKPNKLLHEYKKIYRLYSAMHCKQINETVYFNYQGFRHLIRKYGKVRPRKEYTRKFKLFMLNIESLQYEKFKVGISKSINNNGVAEFISLSSSSLKVKIILRRINKGRLHFFSIMGEK